MDAKDALKNLLEGNLRFVQDRSEHPNRSQERRAEILHKQRPYAVVVTCSDSRVSPTIIFDQGLGDIFIVQNIGEVLSDENIGSIEYAVKYLDVRLVVILGHGNCGAIKAAIEYDGEEISPNIKRLIDAIMPAVEESRKKAKSPEELLDLSIKQNVKNVQNRLKTTVPLLADYSKNENLQIMGAYYCLEVGVVELLEESLVK